MWSIFHLNLIFIIKRTNIMIKLFTNDQFDEAKSVDVLPLKCEHCGKTFLKTKKEIKYALSKRPNTCRYCSISCAVSVNKIKTYCKQCNKELLIYPSKFEKSENHFCSQSCAALYSNTHKTKGTRRSKLEQYLEHKLIETYPSLEINFNDKTAINSELDIYIPSLKLAFELNGIFHYEPIFGESKLNSIQQNDSNKFQKCQEKGISLCVIDTSSQKYFKEQSSNKFFNIIKDIIDSLITI